jgi:D-glycero-D-manno-heptose 1,7-bisphosphate phosphatase
METMHPAIFLDRDGVIIENRELYVRSWTDVTFYPSSLAALAKLRQSPYKIVIVTNQSAVGRGLISLATADQINQQFQKIIVEVGGRVDGLYMCPHKPEDRCACRKPLPGLFLRAASDLSLDLPHSIMIGDALSDIQAGQEAGINRTILLRTGRGTAQLALSTTRELKPFEVFDSLSDAISSIVDSINEAPRAAEGQLRASDTLSE